MGSESFENEIIRPDAAACARPGSEDQTFPDQLLYLDPVLKELDEIPLDELDEDVDISKLEAVLRNRIRGLSIREAQKRITEDRYALESWLNSSDADNEPGAWVAGVLKYRPGALARRLLSAPEAEPSGPAIIFNPPAGWTVTHVPLALKLRRGREKVGVIMAIDDSSFALRRYKNEVRDEIQGRNHNPMEVAGKWTKSPARYGSVHGYKYLYVQTGPVSWKSVQYLLEVPGGAVNITLDVGGKAFDELEFEITLHTLQIAPAD